MKDKEKVDLQFKYAWSWFEYHAAQRLIAFRFYLIIVGAVGWLFLREGPVLDYPLNRFFGIALLVISFFFFLLELRNNQLVNCGRDALDKFEEDNELLNTKYAIRHSDDKSRESCISHSFVIRAIYVIVASIGLILIGMSLCG